MANEIFTTASATSELAYDAVSSDPTGCKNRYDSSKFTNMPTVYNTTKLFSTANMTYLFKNGNYLRTIQTNIMRTI